MNQPLPSYDLPPAKIPFNLEDRLREDAGLPPADVREKGRVECSHCHEWLPFDQFTTLTDPQCARCRSGNAERELNEMKARQCITFSQELVGVAEERHPLGHIENFLAELVYNFGGMRPFVKEWSDQLKRSFQDRPGSRTNLDQCRSIAKLVMDTNKLQHQEDILDLSDEQLRVKKELALMQMLTDAAGDPHRRQMLVELMRTNGLGQSDIQALPVQVQEHITDGR
jgi:hypothetical protein